MYLSEDFEIFYHHLTFTKMKKDYFSQLHVDDYGELNSSHGSRLFLCSNSNPLIS